MRRLTARSGPDAAPDAGANAGADAVDVTLALDALASERVDLTNRAEPTEVRGLFGVVELAVSVAPDGAHSCVRMTDGTARCWGRNLSGELADGTIMSRSLPVPVVSLAGLRILAAGNLGSTHTCALRRDRTVWRLGSNGIGQIGDGAAGTRRLTPFRVAIR